jgi:hypothetical protein
MRRGSETQKMAELSDVGELRHTTVATVFVCMTRRLCRVGLRG